MAKKEKKEKNEEKKDAPNRLIRFFQDERFRICAGLFIVISSLYVLLACISFFFTGWEDQSLLQAADPGSTLDIRSQIKNWTGFRGAIIADALINRTLGISCLFPLCFVLMLGARLLGIKKLPLFRTFVISLFAWIWLSLFLGFCFVSAYDSSFFYLGGEHGYYLSKWFEAQIGWFGTILFLFITLLAFSIVTFPATLPLLKRVGNKLFRKKAQKGDSAEPVDSVSSENTEEIAEGENAENAEDGNALLSQEDGETTLAEEGSQSEEGEETQSADQETVELDLQSEEVESEEKKNEEADSTIENNDFVINVPKGPDGIDESNDEAQNVEDGPEVTIIRPEEPEIEDDITQPYDPTRELSLYKAPTYDLLKQYPNQDSNMDMEEQMANKDKIVQALSDFGIKIEKVTATVGPTVTLYEIVPERGVRITKIKGLENDIALSLAALGIRIIAPIPGKGTIGIEVPNKTAQIVPMRKMISSTKFQETKYDLPVVFGLTITNEVFMADLAKMPHLLVAGATGQGKSVGLNAIITSLLYKKHPSQLKLVMIDPKKVEFSVYSNIDKHFLAKLPDEEDAIVTDVNKVVQTLTSLCKEMDMRYDLLKMAHMRNIKEYNERFINRQLNPEHGHHYLPYIVVIIDEFGDLIMTAGKEVELPIARIAQLARAVGIHMVIATQRPTTNIITGTIKANFPARIAFRVASMIDSRTILDQPGANQLIGRGDMLYLQGSDITRVQCAFVDTPEVEAITEYIAKQQGYATCFALPEVDDVEGGDSGAANVDMSKLDPMFDEAAQLIVSEQSGSTSLIQRKFSLGYNRSGRIMDQLEAAGIVGPARGSKPREVLVVDLIQLQGILDSLRRR